MDDDMRKPVRLVDIAKAADVSVSTVSLALSDHPRIGEATKRRLRQLGRELGYRRPGDRKRGSGRPKSASGHVRRPGRHFGCLLLGSPLRDEINMELLDGLMAAATAADARVELGSVAADLSLEEGIEQAMRFADRLDGVVVSGLVSPELLAAFDDVRLPHVVIGHVMADPARPLPGRTQVISHDEMAMGRLATRSLFDAGHDRVAFISEAAPKYLWADRWLTGYKMAHLDIGAPCDVQLICADMPVHGDAGSVIEQLLKLRKAPTAYVVPDARVARSVVDALGRQGIESADDAIVIGSSAAMAQCHRVAELGRIQPEPCKLAHAALDHLIQLCEKISETALEIILPFTTCNLHSSKSHQPQDAVTVSNAGQSAVSAS